MSDLRIAGAPISWGVCEVPGWGFQLDAERVLSEMAEVGLAASEFGPDGFLPADPATRAELLARHGLRAVGGFLPVVLHDPAVDPMPAVEAFVADCLAARAEVVVLAAATGADGYDARPVLDPAGWTHLLATLQRVADEVAQHGLVPALHPHVGTMVERSDEVDRVLAGTSVGLCVDTGHLLAGGTDPVELVRRHPDRVVHVHLKDVDTALAARVRAGDVPYAEAIPQGLFQPLGAGDVDLRTLVSVLTEHGYTGWYVLEQDVMLAAAPDGEGPVTDVRTSLEHLREVAP